MQIAVYSWTLGRVFSWAPRVRKRQTLAARLFSRFGAARPRQARRFERYREPALIALGSATLTAALMFLFDPARGRNRWEMLAGALRHARRGIAHGTATRVADVGHRTRGFVMERWPFHAEMPDDTVLASRVRAEIGHAAHHPDIEVSAHQGHVVLSGHAAVAEVERLLKRARKVRGVADIENRIEVGPI